MAKNLFSIILILTSYISLSLCVGSKANAQEKAFPFIIVTSDTVKNLPAFTDEDFYNKSTGVVFQAAKSDIRPDDPFFSLYRNEILPLVNNSHLQLRKIYIRGAASPEGSYATNQRLGRARTQALLTELQKELYHQYLKPEIDLNSVTEDYGQLCILMKEANDADYQTVKKIYDGCNGNEQTCKKELMAAQGGKLWARMLKEYFPQLRSARMIMWFSEPDSDHTPISLAMHRPGCSVLCYNADQPYGKPEVEYTPVSEPVKTEKQRALAIRTNLLHDLLYMPQFGFAPGANVQLEYYPKDGHYTYNLGFTWTTHRHWDDHKFFQVRDFQFEVRRYFKGKAEFTGAYIGAYAHGNKYGIGLSDTKGWQGEGGGAGLGIGYVMPLTKKKNLRLEFMAAVGFYMTYYDPYVWGNPVTGTVDNDYYYDYLGSASDFKERNHRFTWFGPTNFGIQLTYDIIYRKRNAQKGGSR